MARTISSGGEIVEEPVAHVIEDMVYVAVTKQVKESKLVLLWALNNCGGKRICIIHVHMPAEMIPAMGLKFRASSLKEDKVQEYREIERESVNKLLDQFLLICQQMGVHAEKLYAESKSIEKGILELISQYGIRKLVMGAAADKHYKKKMMDLKSRKAIFVHRLAPASCNIWFICDGNLIQTREGCLGGTDQAIAPASLQASPNSENRHPNCSRSQSVKLTSPVQDLVHGVRAKKVITPQNSCGGMSSLATRSDTESCSNECDGTTGSTSMGSVLSCSSKGVIDVDVIPLTRVKGVSKMPPFKENFRQSSSSSLMEGSVDDNVYDQLSQAMVEAENSRREAFEEALRRGKAEKDTIEAIRRAKVSESLYAEELKQRKEFVEALANEQLEIERMKNQQDKVMEELQIALDQKSLLEQKILSAVELLQSYKKERDELQMERDNALKEAEELRKSQKEISSSSNMPQFFSDFSLSEIEEATQNFNPSLKIGEGGYGSIYRGLLRHTHVAIKILNTNSLQGPSEFQLEVDVLSKIRHPNLVTLVGACPEAWTLIYEFLPNGNLEDRLNCRDNSPPLSWQTRVRIATEQCSVLIFLHSSKPHSIVHGNLKPASILLDANCVSKLCDFGISRALSQTEFLQPGEITPQSDIYSFGIILLCLLTGRPALGLRFEVQYALDTGNLKNLLDPLAGDWPFVQAEQLANLAMRCCQINSKSPPELEKDVWRVLEPMRASCRRSTSNQLASEEHSEPPPYFICPIFQEVMQDPHIAADGYTYEAEALRGWLESGHDTSPMTNLPLARKNLVPNHALRSAVQEWLQQH